MLTQKQREEYPLALDVTDIKEILGIGINQAYQLIHSNQFHCVRIGRRLKISREEFFNWLEGKV